MNFIRFCIENPVKVSAAVLLLCLFGLLTVTPPSVLPSPIRVPVQLTPDVDIPIVTVQTTWQGASPEEIEREIIDPQEEQLKSLRSLLKMRSNATENIATIEMEFTVGVDVDLAKQDVSDALRRVKYQIPLNEFDNPTVVTGRAMGEEAIAWMILASDRPDVDVTLLFDMVDREVKPVLERVDGVAKLSIFGGREREVQVVVDAARLAQAGVTLREVEDALLRQNMDLSAGNSPQGKRDVVLRTMGLFRSTQDVEATLIRMGPGGPIRIRDVAEVLDGFKRRYEFVRSNGEFVLAIPAYRKTGSNVIEVMEGLREAIRRVNREVLAPKGLGMTLTQVYDETEYIHSAIDLVRSNIWYGGILAVAVLLAFLRSARGTLVVALSIPISIIGTLLVVPACGRNINVVMLAGLAFATGMVVDNAIVVLENIFRHAEMGKDRRTASLEGAAEVWGAVLLNSLTTMIVFLPIVFVQEEAGQLFRDIAIAVSGAVGLSLVVSLTVVPAVAARVLRPMHNPSQLPLIKRGKGGVRPLNKAERRGLDPVAPEGQAGVGGGRAAMAAAGLIRRINSRLSFRLAVVGGATAASIVLSVLLAPRPSYLPAGNENLIFGFLMTPPGYNVQEFARIAERLEAGDPSTGVVGLREVWEARPGDQADRRLARQWSEFVEGFIVPGKRAQMAGADRRRRRELEREIAEWRVAPPPIRNFFFVAFSGTCFMGCTSQDAHRVRPLVNVLNTTGFSIPDSFAFFFQSSIFRNISPGNNVEIEIRGENLETVTDAARNLLTACMFRFGERPRPDPINFDAGRLEARIHPDRVKAADLGLNVADIGFIVRACGDGAIIGQYREGGRSIDLTLRIAGAQDPADARNEIDRVLTVPIAAPTGQVLPLSAVCRVEQTLAPQQINHIETQRAVLLEVRPPPGLSLGDAIEMIENDIVAKMRGEGYELPGPDPQSGVRATIDPSISVRLAGNASKLRTTWDSFKWLLALSGLIVYLLMAGLFESFRFPFVIILTVPLAAVGGFLGLRIVHEWTWRNPNAAIQELDMLTILGFVILLGLVVNNGILIVHQALNFIRYGRAPADAIVESVRTRIRPIFMTVLTTFCGQVPLVVRPGAGAELYRGLGSVVLGGLLVSTVFTLVVIPAMLSLFLSARARTGRWLRLGTDDLYSTGVAGSPDAPAPATLPSAPVPAGR